MGNRLSFGISLGFFGIACFASAGYSQLPNDIQLQTTGACSPATFAGGNAYINVVCGFSPEEIGVLVASIQGQPIRSMPQALSASGSCSPRTYAAKGAIVTTVCGMGPEEAGLAICKATEKIRADLERIRQGADLTDRAARRFLEELGHKNVATEDLPSYLASAVFEYHQLIDQLHKYEGYDPELEALRQQAMDAVKDGDLDRAQSLIRISIGKRRFLRMEQQRIAQEANARRQLGEAKDTAFDASILGMKFELRPAAMRYIEAADLLPDQSDLEGAEWLATSGFYLMRVKAFADAYGVAQRAAAIREKSWGLKIKAWCRRLG